MGFSNQERINLNSKVLAAGVKDANEVGQWYESFFPNSFVLKANKVWSNPDLQTLLDNPAPNLATAQSVAASNPTVIDDFSAAANAIRLTEVPGSNSSTYVAFSIYGDVGSTQLDNWIQPQLVPRNDGAFAGYPSIGFAIRLFEGDPNGGGTEVFTSDGQTGSGVNASVAWVFDYANGMLLISSDYRGTITDPYILGFRYIGSTCSITGLDLDGYVYPAPIISEDGYVALASGNQLSYLGGLNSGEVLTWNSITSSWESLPPTNGVGLGRIMTGTVTTSDATPTTIASFATISDNLVFIIDAQIVARDQSTNESAGYEIKGVFERTAGVLNQINSSTTMLIEEEEDVSWNVDFTTDGYNIEIEVTGDGYNDVIWSAFGNVKILGDTLTSFNRQVFSIASVTQSANTIGFEVISAFEFDKGNYPSIASVTFRSILNTTNALDPAEIRIFNVTTASVVSSSVLSTSSTTSALVSSNITADMADGSNIYEVQLRLQSTTSGSPEAFCKRAELILQ